MDGVEHHIFYCIKSKSFWTKLKNWMIDNLGYGFELTVCELIFGIPDTKKSRHKVIKCFNPYGKMVYKQTQIKRKPNILF